MKTTVNKNARTPNGGASSIRAALQCATGIGLLLSAVAAQAQQAPPDQSGNAAAASSGGLQEVVVTAERRSQNIQDVPIAVTAFTADTLESKGITDIHSLSNLTPNVNLDAGSPFSADTSVLSASIRGIGQDDFAFNLDPGVGVYLDGVYLARTIGANQNLLDVDRIEILKGPQGTLFGANTIGGAINIVTHTPGDEPRFIAEATGGRFDRRDFAFTADMPVNPTLLTSITVSSQVRDGYQKVIPYPTNSVYGEIPFIVDGQDDYPKAGYGSSDTNGGQNLQVIRGKVIWKGVDNFQLTVSGDWAHEDQSSFPNTVLAVYGGPSNIFGDLYNYCISNPVSVLNNPGLSAFGPLTSTVNGFCGPRAAGTGLAPGGAALGGAGYVGYGGPAGSSLLLSQQPRLYWDYAATNTGNIDETYANGPSFARYDAFGGSVTGDWTLAENLDLKSITGYRQIKWDTGEDLDGTPETIQEVTDQQHQFQVSQEFQLNGKAFDNRLDYVTGLYYFHEAGYVHDFVPFEGLLYVYDAANDVDTKNYAAFIHADYKITDQLGLTLGGRYTDVVKHFIGGQEDLNGASYIFAQCLPPSAACAAAIGFPDPAEPLRYFPAGDNEQTWHIFDPTAGLQYHITNDIMSYVSYSKGFKAGGWTTRLSDPILSGTQAEFAPEYSKTYELGLKSEWLDHHLLANAAVFYTNYDGIQLQVQQGASPVTTNAGNAKIKGAELESQWLVGGGLSVNFTYAYLDAYYTYVNPLTLIPQGISSDGTAFLDTSRSPQLPKTPKYKYVLGPTYDMALPNMGTLRFAADFTYTAEMFNDSLNTEALRRPPTRNLDASVHYLSPSGIYEFVVGGTNLTDDRYITVGSINLAAGEVDGTYDPPREWYATIRVKFSQ
jgi:iron complex outermembrane recepter protein